MIESILEQDMYKFSMGNVVNHLFPSVDVHYKFTNRGNTEFPKGFDGFLHERIENMKHLKLTKEEKSYLRNNCSFLSEPYLDFLENFRYNPNEVKIFQQNGNLEIDVIGKWNTTIYWEVVLMAIISELYFEMTSPEYDTREARFLKNKHKINKLKMHDIKFADFGLRRRFSRKNHIEFLNDMVEEKYDGFVGTSTVAFAKEFGIKPIGTMAHEFIVGESALRSVRYANKNAMEDWTRIYRGDLGIVLTDTFGLESFLRDFDKSFSKMFDGVRHDSGCPFSFTDKMINHYNKQKIDAKTKTIVFSDGLNVDTCIKINEYCKDKIGCSFGIGTNFTNDVGVKPLNMVIKLYTVNDIPVAKLSDIPGKATGHEKGIRIAKLIHNME